jgi:hypothetical protein
MSVLTSGAGHIGTPLACASNPAESSKAAACQGRAVGLTSRWFSSGATSASLPMSRTRRSPPDARISAPEHSAPVVTVAGQDRNGAVPISFELSLAPVKRLLLFSQRVLLTLDGKRVQVLQILLSRSRSCEGGLSSGRCRADSSEEQSDQKWYDAAPTPNVGMSS